jgi:adenylate kinase family enzyme
MKRIVIVGTSGCGKTTLGKRISKILNIPCIDLDEYFWLPNWQEREEDEFERIVKELINKEKWIICGNFTRVRHLIWNKADTVIWLDYSFFRCFFQIFFRSLKRGIKKERCCNGNYESLSRAFFSKHSILLHIITTFKKRRETYNRMFNDNVEGKTYFRFTSPNEINKWIKLCIFRN